MLVADWLTSLAAGLGHCGLFLAALNRLHALHLASSRRRACEALLGAASGGALAGVLEHAWRLQAPPGSWSQAAIAALAEPWCSSYLAVCWTAAVVAAATWLRRRFRRPPAALASEYVEVIDVARQLGVRPVRGVKARWAAALPRNELFQLHVHHKTLLAPRLPQAWNGVRIAHLSDLHLEGSIGWSYFQQVIDTANRLRPDLIAVTGDLIDDRRVLPWLGRLARLRAPLGVYFVLGNHDLKFGDDRELRDRLAGVGWLDCGQHVHALRRGPSTLVLAGNELPWFGPPAWDRQPPADCRSETYRVLLSHAPDQIGWARAREFDLLLAGHTHGGQVRLPGLGPLFVPSRHGLKYDAGLYQEAGTLMHVVRGVGGLEPIRFHCPPELALLELRSGDQSNRKAARCSPRSAESGSAAQACC